MEAFDCTLFRAGVNRALAVVPDGMPLVWCLRQLGHRGQERVAGPDLLPHLCDAAARRALSVGFYGGTVIALQQCTANLVHQYPELNVALMLAPPFRPLTQAETSAMVDRIQRLGRGYPFRGARLPEAGAVDDGECGPHPTCVDRYGRSDRLSCRHVSACVCLDAAAGAGVVVPARRRAAAPSTPIRDTKSALYLAYAGYIRP